MFLTQTFWIISGVAIMIIGAILALIGYEKQKRLLEASGIAAGLIGLIYLIEFIPRNTIDIIKEPGLIFVSTLVLFILLTFFCWLRIRAE